MGVLAKITAACFTSRERSQLSNIFCKASESQPRGSLLLMNAWTSREFALSLPHPPNDHRSFASVSITHCEGMISTAIDRPALQRSARAHCFDADEKLNRK